MKKGFTLVEIVISICIISIAFYSLINVLRSVTLKNVGSQQLLVASFLAEEVMEEYSKSGTAWTDIVSRDAASFTGDFSNFTNKVDVYFVDPSNLDLISGTSTDYKRIEVTVTGAALDYPVKLTSLKTNY